MKLFVIPTFATLAALAMFTGGGLAAPATGCTPGRYWCGLREKSGTIYTCNALRNIILVANCGRENCCQDNGGGEPFDSTVAHCIC